MDENLKNNLFNNAIDLLFSNVVVNNEEISEILKKEEMIKFFYLILNEFGSNPDEIRKIFENINPNNNNLNMIFKENAQNLLSNYHLGELNFMDIFKNYINFAISSEELSHIHICYNTCKRLIINVSYNIMNNNKEKIEIIHKCISELCFNCPNIFIYNNNNDNNVNNNNNNNINDQKRKLILKESFNLFKDYIKTKNKIHLFYLTKNNIIELINKYSTNSHIQLLLLYQIFQHRIFQCDDINVYKHTKFNYELYKENFYSYFNFLDLYYDYFIVQKNKNFELENIFIVLMSQITKYYPEYNYFNNELFDKIKIIEKQKINFFSFYDQNFFIKNIKIYNDIFFFKNPYRAAILFINIFMKNKNLSNIDSINYYDLDKLFKNLVIFIDNEIKEEYCENNNIIETKKNVVYLFIKVCIIIYIFISNDLIIFAPLVEPEEKKFNKNSSKFFIKLINTLFLLLKRYQTYFTTESKEKLLLLMNEISTSNPIIYFYMLENDSFDEELIHFLHENIPNAIMSLKQLTFLYKYDNRIEPNIFLNALIMFGYWVNKYPFRERYNNGLNILTYIQKSLDIRQLLKTDKNVDKFILGIYLFFKAFPKSKNDTKDFLNFLTQEIDYSFEKKTKEKIDNLCQFIKKELFMNNSYSNKNTLFVDINEFVKNNFNK